MSKFYCKYFLLFAFCSVMICNSIKADAKNYYEEEKNITEVGYKYTNTPLLFENVKIKEIPNEIYVFLESTYVDLFSGKNFTENGTRVVDPEDEIYVSYVDLFGSEEKEIAISKCFIGYCGSAGHSLSIIYKQNNEYREADIAIIAAESKTLYASEERVKGFKKIIVKDGSDEEVHAFNGVSYSRMD